MSMNMRVSVGFSQPLGRWSLALTTVSDVGKSMDQSIPEIQKSLEPHLAQFGQRQDNKSGQSIFDVLDSDRFAERKNA